MRDECLCWLNRSKVEWSGGQRFSSDGSVGSEMERPKRAWVEKRQKSVECRNHVLELSNLRFGRDSAF